jgi:hypothetical protein
MQSFSPGNEGKDEGGRMKDESVAVRHLLFPVSLNFILHPFTHPSAFILEIVNIPATSS